MITKLTTDAAPEFIELPLVVLDFTAKWCMPCKRMAPILEAASKRLPHVSFASVDINECGALTRAFALHKVPTLIVLKDGAEVRRVEGMVSESALVELIESLG